MKQRRLIVVLLVINVIALIFRRDISRDEGQLVAELVQDESEQRSQVVSMAKKQALIELVEIARRGTTLQTLDSMASVRSVLVTAAEGLVLSHDSLELHKLEDSRRTSYTGARTRLSLSGPYWQLVEYLRRLDDLMMPLSLIDLSLTGDGDGKLEMIASWLAMWPEAGSPNRALSYDEINSMKAWLSRVEHVQHSRNLFRFVYDEPVTMTPPLLKTHAVNEPIGLGPKVGLPKIELPVLTGFLWARPEQQPEPHKRVAAQLRYQGKGTLVHRGDRVGEFLVHRIDAPDTVTLVNVGTGSEVVLYLE